MFIYILYILTNKAFLSPFQVSKVPVLPPLRGGWVIRAMLHYTNTTYLRNLVFLLAFSSALGRSMCSAVQCSAVQCSAVQCILVQCCKQQTCMTALCMWHAKGSLCVWCTRTMMIHFTRLPINYLIVTVRLSNHFVCFSIHQLNNSETVFVYSISVLVREVDILYLWQVVLMVQFVYVFDACLVPSCSGIQSARGR